MVCSSMSYSRDAFVSRVKPNLGNLFRMPVAGKGILLARK
jgi:hypothetical protein